MYWIGILSVGEKRLLSMVFDKTDHPKGFAFFTSKQKLDDYLNKQTALEYESHEVEGDMKTEQLLEFAIQQFSTCFDDFDLGATVAMESMPIFVDPITGVVDNKVIPNYNNLLELLSVKFRNVVKRNVASVKLAEYKGYTYLVHRFASDNTFTAVIKPGFFKEEEVFIKAEVEKKGLISTEFVNSADEAEKLAKELIDSFNEPILKG